MMESACRLGLPILLLAGVVIAKGVGQDQRGVPARTVQDDAKLFSKDAIETANGVGAKIREKHHKAVWFETIENGPAAGEAAKWAEERAEKAGLDGVYIVISKEPRHFEIVVAKKTRSQFSVANRDEVKAILARNLKDNRDEALVKSVEYISRTLDKNSPAARLVKDELKLFSPEAIEQANKGIAEIKQKYRRDLLIETLVEGKPADEMAAWANERSKKAGVDGIYIVITEKPKRFEIVVEKTLLDRGAFRAEDRAELKQTLQKHLGKASDEALRNVVQETLAAFGRNGKANEKNKE